MSEEKTVDQTIAQFGFVICEFPPDGDECERCDKPNLQLYYRRTCYEVEEGEYWCLECIKKAIAEAAEHEKRMQENVTLYDGTIAQMGLCLEIEGGEHDGEYALATEFEMLESGDMVLASESEECNECGRLFRSEEVTAGTCESCFALEGCGC